MEDGYQMISSSADGSPSWASLEKLTLTNNSLDVLDDTLESLFHSFTSLTVLNLSHNAITSVGDITVLKHLTTLDLSFNKINVSTHISRRYFHHCSIFLGFGFIRLFAT